MGYNPMDFTVEGLRPSTAAGSAGWQPLLAVEGFEFDAAGEVHSWTLPPETAGRRRLLQPFDGGLRSFGNGLLLPVANNKTRGRQLQFGGGLIPPTEDNCPGSFRAYTLLHMHYATTIQLVLLAPPPP